MPGWNCRGSAGRPAASNLLNTRLFGLTLTICGAFGVALAAKLLVTMLGRSHSSQEGIPVRMTAQAHQMRLNIGQYSMSDNRYYVK
jgi:hypothetical protein